MPEASKAQPAAISSQARRMFLFLMVLTAASQIGMQGWVTLFNNFAVERAGFGGFEVGLVQGLREVPGFLSLLVVYVLLVLPEHRIVALAIATLGLGVGLTGLFPSFWGIAATTLIMSFGFHYYETLNMSLTLQYFDRSQAPLVFGRLRSVTGISNIAVGLLVLLATRVLDYPGIYAGLGVVVAAAGLWALTQNPSHAEVPVQRKKMFLRRKYTLYYILTFLAGARRQVFMAFAVFLLVKKFGMSVGEITGLFIFNNAVNVVANPLIGRAINRYGERALLTVEYLTVTVVFCVYAFSESKLLVACLYVLDQLVINFAMCVSTYFQKVGDPKDIAPTMAVGFTINHIAAVVIPVVGGALWLWDARMVFLGGAVLSLCSLIAAQFIRTPPAEAGAGSQDHVVRAK
ncbi:MAG TPA: MFS transporter [Humidesulfovibrio sp.]|uniref:MFS transporter n=1 Tax=Humidesulfovibrio sp. TaxID=2910988 RepID=UPI002C7FE41A|nr:MFS transporter [Humidesulfovibrio sp.]HWR04595.1 MFS transporter [Humidesulfovibrio sp.]